MKNLYIILLIAFLSCKKKDNPPAVTPTPIPAPVQTTPSDTFTRVSKQIKIYFKILNTEGHASIGLKDKSPEGYSPTDSGYVFRTDKIKKNPFEVTLSTKQRWVNYVFSGNSMASRIDANLYVDGKLIKQYTDTVEAYGQIDLYKL